MAFCPTPLPMAQAAPLTRTELALIRFVNLPFAVVMPVLLVLITAIGWVLSKHGLHSTSLSN